jgi:hypothetical protein
MTKQGGKHMQKRDDDVVGYFMDQLVGIQSQLSLLLKDRRLRELVGVLKQPPIHPSGGVMCMVADASNLLNDFQSSLDSMHRWISAIIEALDNR